MITKPKKTWSEARWVALCLALILVICFLIARSFGASDTLYVRAHWGSGYDTAWAVLDTNEQTWQTVSLTSAEHPGFTGHDTAWVFTAGQKLCVTFFLKSGDDTVTWAWIKDGNLTTVSSADSGAYSVTALYLDDVDSTTPLENVSVAAYNAAQTNQIGTPKRTDANGEVTFNLDADNFVFVASAIGYSFPTYDTHTVAGAQTDTIYGTGYTATPPTLDSMCTVYGYLRDIIADSVSGRRVWIGLDRITRNLCDSVLVWRDRVSVKTDANGKFEIQLYYSSCWQNGGLYTVEIEGFPLKYKLEVPSQASYQMSWHNR